MNLDELLKVSFVRCIKTKVGEDLVEGEVYKVEGFNDETIKIVDRNGFSSWHNKNLFEPVIYNNIDMDKLEELLKVSKVRCVASYDERLTVGKEYDVVGTDVEIQVKDDDEGFSYWGSDCFEPVLNNDIDLDELVNHLAVGKSWKEVGCNYVVTITEISSEFANSTMVAFESDCCLSSSPLEMFLKDFTPVINNDVSKSDNEIDISLDSVNDVNNVNTTFKVGDKVYCPLADGQIKTLHLNEYSTIYPLTIVEGSSDEIDIFDERGRLCVKGVQVLYHATQENYEMLCKLYPHIEFEIPPKPLTGSDLCRAMLDKGWKLVPCVVSGISDSEALNNDDCCLVDEWCVNYFDSDGYRYKYAVPFDPKTGIPLTEDVLNETI